MKSWVKLYTESNRDPKIGTLTWAERGIWAAVLCLAGEIDDRDAEGAETGALDTLDNVAWHLRCDAGELAGAVEAFTERGMIDERDGVLFVTNYTQRQGRPPSSRPALVAERVKRHRERVTPTADETCNEGVTRVQRGVTPSDSETDADSEAETEGGATPQTAPAPAPEAPPPAPREGVRRKDRRTDPRSQHPAIVAARAATASNRYPPLELYDALIEVLGTCPDAERLDRCRQAWVTRGFNPNAWTWAIEWYRDGVPDRARAPAGVGANGQRADGRPTGAAGREAFLRRHSGGNPGEDRVDGGGV